MVSIPTLRIVLWPSFPFGIVLIILLIRIGYERLFLLDQIYKNDIKNRHSRLNKFLPSKIFEKKGHKYFSIIVGIISFIFAISMTIAIIRAIIILLR